MIKVLLVNGRRGDEELDRREMAFIPAWAEDEVSEP
jgi:hypothetical protein